MAPSPAREASSQCWARVTPSPVAYSRARRISPADCTPLPSSVNRRTPSAASSAIGARRSPARPTVMAPATATSAMARSASVEDVAHRLGRVQGGLGVGHGHHGGEAPEGGGPGPGLDGLGLLAARLAQVGVEVDQARGDHAAAGVQHAAPPWAASRSAPPRSPGHPPPARRPRARRSGRRPCRPAARGRRRAAPVVRVARSATAGPVHRALAEQQEQHRHADGHPVAHLFGDRARPAARPPRRRSPPRGPSDPGGG